MGVERTLFTLAPVGALKLDDGYVLETTATSRFSGGPVPGPDTPLEMGGAVPTTFPTVVNDPLDFAIGIIIDLVDPLDDAHMAATVPDAVAGEHERAFTPYDA